MIAPKIYLETTMFSFYHEKKTMPPYLELKAEVHRIFDLIKAGEYEPFTSTFATNEIEDTTDQEKRANMWRLIDDYGITVLQTSPQVENWLLCIFKKVL